MHSETSIRNAIIKILPNVWIINDDFIVFNEIQSYSDGDTSLRTSLSNDNILYGNNGVWTTYGSNMKQSSFLSLLSHIPINNMRQDMYKLDIILDDYLTESFLVNQSESVLKGKTPKRQFINCDILLTLPHNIQLDFSVLLTASILFSVPSPLFLDTCISLLSSYMSLEEITNYIAMPRYIKTAIVSVLRRIVKKTHEEMIRNKCIYPKTKYIQISTDSRCTPPADEYGFIFVKSYRSYLLSDIPTLTADIVLSLSAQSSQFTDLEIEFLNTLPDIPTLATCSSADSSSFRSWVSLVARHTVVLMTRVPSCPPLTKCQTSKHHQDLYDSMQELLTAAGMTYKDLEIPHADGRKVNQKGEVLSYGSGIPNGRISSLVWNKSTLSRSYVKPWLGEVLCNMLC
jgi:hypothetical protein